MPAAFASKTYFVAVNSKHRKSLAAVFTDSVSDTIEWAIVEKVDHKVGLTIAPSDGPRLCATIAGVKKGDPKADVVRVMGHGRSAAGEPLYRVHRSTFGPVFYGPGFGNPRSFRFDCPRGRFGILYIAPGPDAAMIETLLRNP